jgi:hypothetical protein
MSYKGYLTTFYFKELFYQTVGGHVLYFLLKNQIKVTLLASLVKLVKYLLVGYSAKQLAKHVWT